ncbi:hypothetical protein SNE40_012377 [Patella caerulea]|uniref:Uncharacterized protein n=1 Tax=Patella caerulea TaxID=87958 RepID=A0AAN8JLM1_PATCE
MVCVPCIVIPFLIWFYNRYLRPIVGKLWKPSTEKIECPFKGKSQDSGGTVGDEQNQLHTKPEENGVANGVANGVPNGVANGKPNGHAVAACGEDKKTL